MRNAEEERAKRMRVMISNQKQQAAQQRELNMLERQQRTRQQIEEKPQREAEE